MVLTSTNINITNNHNLIFTNLCLRTVSYMPNTVDVFGLSILDKKKAMMNSAGNNCFSY